MTGWAEGQPSSYSNSDERNNNDIHQQQMTNNYHRKHIDSKNVDSQIHCYNDTEASPLVIKHPLDGNNADIITNTAMESNRTNNQHYYATKISLDNGSFSEEREGCLRSSTATITGTIAAQVFKFLLHLWNEYNELLDKHPVLVKMITATIILGCSDLFAQSIEHFMVKRTSNSTSNEAIAIDWPRAIRFGLIGLVGAPWSHYYFTLLDHCLPPTIHPCSWITFIKVCIDQFIQSPLMLIGMISFLCILEGRGWNGIKHDMKTSFVTSMIANWKLWIPASFINLGFVKPSLRVLYVNVVFFVWIVILSLLLNSNTAMTN